MADRRLAYNNTTKARLQKRCPHGGHDIKDAAIAHLRKMWFPPKENSPRKGESAPKRVTTPEGVAVAGPNPAASSLHPTAPPLRAGPGHLRPATRRPPHQVRPKENPDWTVSLRPPELPLLTSSRLNPTETPHKEGEEFKKGEGADWQQGRRRTAASSHEH
uniref:Uncharacterized protein n=1 Tax=Oryza nivara TaxID=4536 RepID=A0A0E0I4Q9_ORYNI